MTGKAIRLDLGDRSYDVQVGSGTLDQIGDFVASLGSVRQVAVISDSNVAPLYGVRAVESIKHSGLEATLIEFPAGEANKTMATFSHLLDSTFAITPAVDRGLVVVAVGGGVTGDMSGYVAASVLRGVRWVQCPTTLLADVDASVGGKTGINHPSGKNLIGAFHQPAGVLIDAETLKTLPPAELSDGLAESVKHGVIRDEGLLTFLEANAQAILACQSDVMVELIARNVEIKASVVSADERESGVRAHLNFGHTIGHAIETLEGYGTISHGQGVALGMVAAMELAVMRKLVTSDAAGRIEALLTSLNLPVKRQGLDSQEIWRIMQHDKKVRNGKVRMVLPTKLGAVDIFDDITAEEVFEAVQCLETV